MTLQTPVDQVVSHLELAGFKRLKMPFEIASLEFNFPAVLISEGNDADLVVVADTVSEKDVMIQEKLEGIVRALDIMGSTRSITAVVAGPRPSHQVLEDISRVCRILPIGDTADATLEAALNNWLRVLTPLKITEIQSQTSDALERLTESKSAPSPILRKLLRASFQNPDDVTEAVRSYLQTALEPLAILENE